MFYFVPLKNKNRQLINFKCVQCKKLQKKLQKNIFRSLRILIVKLEFKNLEMWAF